MSHRSFRFLKIGIGLLIVGVGAFYAMDWYNHRYRWPQQIQSELFGTQIVGDDMFLGYDGSSGFTGEGMFRWTYKILPENAEVAKLCGPTPVAICKFGRHRRLTTDEVDLSATYENGILTLEEWWM